MEINSDFFNRKESTLQTFVCSSHGKLPSTVTFSYVGHTLNKPEKPVTQLIIHPLRNHQQFYDKIGTKLPNLKHLQIIIDSIVNKQSQFISYGFDLRNNLLPNNIIR